MRTRCGHGSGAGRSRHRQLFRRSVMPIATVNPANGETLRTYEAMGEEELERRLQLAEATFRTYRATRFVDRARLMIQAANLLDEDQQDIARIMTTEMGKPVKQARAEAAKCA